MIKEFKNASKMTFFFAFPSPLSLPLPSLSPSLPPLSSSLLLSFAPLSRNAEQALFNLFCVCYYKLIIIPQYASKKVIINSIIIYIHMTAIHYWKFLPWPIQSFLQDIFIGHVVITDICVCEIQYVVTSENYVEQDTT